MEKKVGVFGAGPGGISAVRRLSELGHNVSWYYPERFVRSRSIYSTSTECKALNKVIKPEDQVFLTHLRLLTMQGADVSVATQPGKYFVLNNVNFIRSLVDDTSQRNLVQTETHPTKILNNIFIAENDKNVELIIDGKKRTFDAVVDATGVSAHLASKVEDSRSYESYLAEYVYGGRFLGHLEKPEMILLSGPAGGTCWVCPSADHKDSIDVIYSAYGPSRYFYSRFLQTATKRLDLLLEFLKTVPGLSFSSMKKQDMYIGMIRSQATQKPRSKYIYAIGEAAGMARPTTGQSLDRSFSAGQMVADAIDSGLSPAKFYKVWTKIWKDSLFLSGTIARLPFQKRGELGAMFNKLHQLQESHQSQAVIESALKWFVDKKLSPEALFYIFTDIKFLSSFLLVLAKHLEIKIRGPEQAGGDQWSLPEVEIIN